MLKDRGGHVFSPIEVLLDDVGLTTRHPNPVREGRECRPPVRVLVVHVPQLPDGWGDAGDLAALALPVGHHVHELRVRADDTVQAREVVCGQQQQQRE